MSKDAKDTYVVRFSHEIVVKCGDEKAVEEAAKYFHEAMLPPILKREVQKLEEPAETRMRVKMQDGIPMFIRMPIVLDSIDDIAKFDAEPGENAKVKGTDSEGYMYRPDVKPGANGLDLRYTITSKAPKGGVWIDVSYLRMQARAAAQAQAEAQARGGNGMRR
jgi:hypothetical protein